MNRVLQMFFFLVVFCVSGMVNAEGVVWFDDFSRPDSADLDNGWVEVNEKLTSDYVGGLWAPKAFISVDQGGMAFTYGGLSSYSPSYGTLPYAYKILSGAVDLPASYSFTYSPHQNERVFHEVGLMNSVDGMVDVSGTNYVKYHPYNGIVIQIGRSGSSYDNSSLLLHKYVDGVRSDGAVHYLSFQYDYGEVYKIRVELLDMEHVRVSVSSGGDIYGYEDTLSSGELSLDQFVVNGLDTGASMEVIGAQYDYILYIDNITLFSPTMCWFSSVDSLECTGKLN